MPFDFRCKKIIRTMQKGTIGVTTENIFPVIKKFLYSDHEIFLRELVSNAVDATQKLNALVLSGEFKGEVGETSIKVSSDNKKKIITISDSGIGMTEEEVDKYINQIAFSSAGEFLEKYKDQLNNIIGHFGLGFYSSFMVSKRVEIDTLSWKEGATPVKWSCEGDPNYTITKGKRKERGTTITLYLDDESAEYSENFKINQLLNKYCKFLPIEISFKDGDIDKIVNITKPIWTKKPVDLKEQEYTEFYKELYPMQEDPLFYIHLNVDYPFNLTGVLYFPKIKDKIDLSRNKIQLYSNQVFVTDSVENIVPDFLTLLHGVIDSPDIPLNVSRSYLQSDSNVKKISAHITKKVADRLEDIFKTDRANFESKWDNLKLFIEYGMLTDEKFYERAEKFTLLKNTEGKFFTFNEYKTAIETSQTDRDKKLVYIYTTNAQEQFTHIESAKNKGYDVLIFDNQLDAHYVNLLESKFTDSKFARVDSDTIDKLIIKDELEKVDLQENTINDINKIFEGALPKGANYSLSIEKLSDSNNAVIITQSEFMRRYKEMSALGGGLNFYGELPDSYNVTLNYSNKLIQKIIEESLINLNDTMQNLEGEAREAELMKYGNDNEVIKQLCDLALISNNLLKGEALNKFVKRSLSILTEKG